MVTHQQADQLFTRNKEALPNLARTDDFSPRYEQLSRVIRLGYYDLKQQPEQLYLQHFDGEETLWQTPEGERLATRLFGPLKAPYVSAIWQLIPQLPYQNGYNRRPFRIGSASTYLASRLEALKRLYESGIEGFYQLSIADTLRYAPYQHQASINLAPLFATALMAEEGEGPLRELAWDILTGEDEIGGISRSLVQGLLMTDRPEDHKRVEQLLLAAQRQEGLRQTVLESVDQASLGALQHFMEVILAHDLSRFSSVVRAVDTWFGFGWEAPKKKVVARILRTASDCMTDPARAEHYLATKDHLETYVALWAMAINDVTPALQKAANLLREGEKHQRITALYFISQTNFTHRSLADFAADNFGRDALVDYYTLLVYPAGKELSGDLYDRVIARAASLPKDGQVMPSGVFDWLAPKVTPEYFYKWIITNGTLQQLLALAGNLADLPSLSREALLRALLPNHYNYSLRYADRKQKTIDTQQFPWVRGVMHQALTDRNGAVMATGVTVLRSLDRLNDQDAKLVTDLLRRKGKELRGALIKLIVSQPDPTVTDFTGPLLGAGSVDQRLAGLEVLSLLKDADRLPEYVGDQVTTYRARAKFSKNETVLLERFAPVAERNGLSVENGFGAVDYTNTRSLPTPRLKFTAPKKTGLLDRLTGATHNFFFAKFVDGDKIKRALDRLAKIIHGNGSFEYTLHYRNGHEQTVLLQDSLSLRHPQRDNVSSVEALDDLPLAENFKAWYTEAGLNDFELYYACLYARGKRARADEKNAWSTQLRNHYYPQIPGVDLRVGERGAGDVMLKQMGYVTNLFYRAYADHGTMRQFQVDLLEDILARWPEEHRVTQTTKDRWGNVREHRWTTSARHLLPSLYSFENAYAYAHIENDLLARQYDLRQLLYAASLSENYPPPHLSELIDADGSQPKYYYGRVSQHTALGTYLHRQGLATDDDLLLNALHQTSYLLNLLNAEAINAKHPDPNLHYPLGVADELAANLLEVELDRGDLASEATKYTSQLRRIEGVEYLVELNERMGKETLHRGYSYGNVVSKKESFSALIKKTVPAAADTVEAFVGRAKATEVTTRRWLEVAMYAPQWAGWIGELLKLPELTSAVWWFHAHASEYSSKEKAATIARYSPIDVADFREGAIDIDWFTDVYAAVGKKTWKLLHDAAKYISSGNGHRQVKLYSSIMLGEVKITETLKRVKEKRDKVYVKGLGLVPLSRRSPRKDALRRYELLQRFLEESKQFGNQRRESEKKAVEIGLENLARNAGYDDPVRFSWVMEGQSTQRIMETATVEIEKLRVELVIGPDGKPDIVIEKDGNRQKSIPTKLRKDKRIVALKENKAELRKQHRRTLKSLEKAMVDGQAFTVAEIVEINEHPIVRTLLEKLVFFHPAKQLCGFWRRGVLNDVAGKPYELGEEESLRIAHPTDLYATVQWDLLQRYAFDQKLVQPFKQIFRELYLLTANEREEKYKSSRYQGNQIQTKKAVALLTGRGWTVGYDTGPQKVDYKRGVVASLYAMADWFSPADIEAPTLEEVAFHSRKDYRPVALDDLDPILFSETMRDIDLVVSVAHAGQVDPEASHSSMEMRAALARESARLFRLENVTVKQRHLVIAGRHGTYSIHLGSGMVSKNGLQLGIIPVHSQHRGRIFLPFVDDDPKSAEIISKMKLLAEDDRIQDPTVLAQLMK